MITFLNDRPLEYVTRHMQATPTHLLRSFYHSGYAMALLFLFATACSSPESGTSNLNAGDRSLSENTGKSTVEAGEDLEQSKALLTRTWHFDKQTYYDEFLPQEQQENLKPDEKAELEADIRRVKLNLKSNGKYQLRGFYPPMDGEGTWSLSQDGQYLNLKKTATGKKPSGKKAVNHPHRKDPWDSLAWKIEKLDQNQLHITFDNKAAGASGQLILQ